MSWERTASSGGSGGTVKAPAGNHLAVLIGLVQMGTQEIEFQGEVKQQKQVYLLWELVGEQVAGTTKNHVIGAAVTDSLNEKATLRKWIQGRTGKAIPNDGQYDLSAELGQGCMLSVVEKNGYPRVEAVAGLPKGLPVPTPGYKPVAITLDEIRDGKEIPEHFPWHYGNPLIDHIRASKEIGGAKPARKPKDDKPAPVGGPVPF